MTPGLGFSASGCVSIGCDLMDEGPRFVLVSTSVIGVWDREKKKKKRPHFQAEEVRRGGSGNDFLNANDKNGLKLTKYACEFGVVPAECVLLLQAWVACQRHRGLLSGQLQHPFLVFPGWSPSLSKWAEGIK